MAKTSKATGIATLLLLLCVGGAPLAQAEGPPEPQPQPSGDCYLEFDRAYISVGEIELAYLKPVMRCYP